MNSTNADQSLNFAYIAQGELFHHTNGVKKQIVSQFGQEIIDRAARTQQLQSWKNEGNDGNALMAGRSLWGGNSADLSGVHVRIVSVTTGDEQGRVLYALGTNKITGLLDYTVANDREVRLFHKSDFRLVDIARHPAENRLAASVAFGDGTASIATMNSDGRRMQTVTEGDSADLAPAWVPNQDNVIVYQSSGVARNTQGLVAGFSPFRIEELNLKTGALMTLADNPQFDFLNPHKDARGNLYCIRRPYQTGGRGAGVGTTLTDIVMFPFRLLRTLFDYLNYQSMMYSRKPLTNAGGPNQEQDVKQLYLWGRKIEVEKALRSAKRNDDTPAIVPKNWELVRIGSDGEQTTLAAHVASFDISAEGQIVYSNGNGVFTLQSNGKSKRIAKHRFIERVFALG